MKLLFINQHIPVVISSIAGTKIVGSMTVGNKKGLLVPNTITEAELTHLTENLPEEVKIA